MQCQSVTFMIRNLQASFLKKDCFGTFLAQSPFLNLQPTIIHLRVGGLHKLMV